MFMPLVTLLPDFGLNVVCGYANPRALAEVNDMPYTGEIRMLAFGVTPSGWLVCDGSLISKTVYAALYAVVGDRWGVSGGSFNLPDLRSRVPIGTGQGSGLTLRFIGDYGGEENHQLDVSELPSHTHVATDSGHIHAVTDPTHRHASAGAGNFVTSAAGSEYVNTAGNKGVTVNVDDFASTGLTVNSGNAAVTNMATGGGGSHNNLQPSASVFFMIKT